MSTRPCFRSSASVTEKPLETLISIFGNSSRRIWVAGASQAASCPVRKPRAKIALVGRPVAARRLDGGLGLRQRQPSVIQKGASGRRQLDAAHAADEERDADFMLEVPNLATQ